MTKYPEWQFAQELRGAATSAAEMKAQLSRWADVGERREDWKRLCARLGLEVLTSAACAFLYGRSPTTVRAARRKDQAEAVAFTLCLARDGERDMHLIRFAWAETKWPRPKDFTDRLELLREQGEVISFSGGPSYLVLSPTPIRIAGDSGIPEAIEREAAERRDHARRQILMSSGKYKGASAYLDAARAEDTEIERHREAELVARLERSPEQQPSSRSVPSIEL